MLVLHGAWLAGTADPYEGRLALWGEDLEMLLGLRRVAVGVASHPYAATPEQLAAALVVLGAGSAPRYLTATAWLPTVEGFPLPSYALEQLLSEPQLVSHQHRVSERPVDDASSHTGAGSQPTADAPPTPSAQSSVGSQPSADSQPDAGSQLGAGAQPSVGPQLSAGPQPDAGSQLGAGAHSSASSRPSAGSQWNGAIYQGQSSSNRTAARLRQYAVPVCVVPAMEAVPLLSEVLASRAPAPSDDVVVADDLRFFAELVRFAISLLSQGKVLPVLEPCAGASGRRFQARWRLVVDRDDDVERYRLLVRSVPPVCRAFSMGGAESAGVGTAVGTHSPTRALGRGEVVRGFLALTSDALVRAWIGDVSADVAGGDTVRSWLRALKHPNALLTVDGDDASQARVSAGISGYDRDDSEVEATPTVGGHDRDDSEVEATPAIGRRGEDDGEVRGPLATGDLDTEASQPLTVSRRERTALARLCKATADWARMVSNDVLPSAFRTCFRLEPPANPTEDPDWTLRYFIVDERDHSLLISASTVWREGGGTLSCLNRRYERPRDILLADLKRAGEICPPIKRSLDVATPAEYCVLSPLEAYTFLKATGATLQRLGFVVLMPMIERLRQKPRVRMRIQSGNEVTTSRFNLESLLTYDWRVALGDDVMDATEFQFLVNLKTPLVSVRGKWVELDPSDLWQVSHLLDQLGEGGTVTLSRAIYLSSAGGNEGYESAIEGVETDDRLQTILDLLWKADSYAELEAPEGFEGQLRPYQARGLSWLHFLTSHGFGACLADDMGLGKTIQLLALALHFRSTVPEKGRRPILIICPASVVYNWQREAERFAPSLKVLVYHGADRATGRTFASEADRHDLVITTYALASRDSKLLTQVNWSGLVLDEAQNIKNPATKQARSIKRFRAEYRVALTGTPVENRLTELWSIMDFLNPGYLGSLKGFKSHYATPIERYRDSDRAERLRQVVRPFILRRLKTDPAVIRDLPAKEEIKTYCNLTAEQATLYEAFVQSTLARVEDARGIERKGLILAMLTGLKQICNHPANFLKDQRALDGRSGKLSRLTEMLDEVVSGGDSALVFTQFVEMGELLVESLGQRLGCEVLFLHGGVPARRRAEMVSRFQSEECGPTVFVLSLRAGGTGLNLTTASRVFHYDRWWNPAVENQATDRAFRIGQKRNVQVYKFICRGTLEERIDALIDEKKELAESVIGSGEDWVTELTTEELRQLIALDGGAVIHDEE